MVFCFVRKFFFGQHELEYLFFLSRKAGFFFLQNLTLGYMTKTQIFFFPPPKLEYFFQQHRESEYFLEVKWPVPNVPN